MNARQSVVEEYGFADHYRSKLTAGATMPNMSLERGNVGESRAGQPLGGIAALVRVCSLGARQFVLSLCICAAMATAAGAQNVSPKLVQLHKDLQLSANQEDGWRAYTNAIAPDPRAQARRRAAQQLLGQLTTPRRIALIDAMMQADIDDFRRQGAAVTAFYATLSPHQQQTFDRETVPQTQARSEASDN